MKFKVKFIEYHEVIVTAKHEVDAQEKAEKLLEKGDAGDTFVDMEFTFVEVVK